ncbi:phenylalanine N-monooxygenase-like isoform X4 [Gossypium arboreum]|uniref:phenylalanine N-monooxygenase-like isoform X4 n=1 Tax=Gossypium arboreum TaxID=29729 RepID=UPI0022F1D981|nr:phenylalanine N-monooxygenase-like isoform X4 [Gossypium arboreum]
MDYSSFTNTSYQIYQLPSWNRSHDIAVISTLLVSLPLPLVLMLLVFVPLVVVKLKGSITTRSQPPLPPGPIPWPIIGNPPEIWQNKPVFRWILGLMKQLGTDIACIRLGHVHVIAVTSPEIAREFLKKHDSVFASRPKTMAAEYATRGFLIKEWGQGKRKEPQDLLDAFILAKDLNGKPTLSAEEIKAQITELMLAAVDNPANAAEWAMAEMLNNPEILRKATDEIDSVVGKSRLVEETDIPKLNYIKCCAREAFRLHTIAPFNVPHVSNADTTVAGYFIPKGSCVLISRRGLDPKVWEEPLEFKPERHLKDEWGSGGVELTENELRFISFGTGRRGCIGVGLGSAVTIMLFARLIQGFTWEVPPNGTKIDLSESKDDTLLAKPLHALAKPRLSPALYTQL